MKNNKVLLIILTNLFFGTAFADTNIALNAPVTLNGTFLGSTASSLTDGTFFKETTYWATDPAVYWTGTSNTITINLGGEFNITSFIVQADDNDIYKIDYWNGSSWALATNIDAIVSYGLVTRDISLPTPITTNALQISAVSGDYFYAVSQVEAFGSAVPEPSELVMLSFGLLGLGLSKKSRISVFSNS